MDIEGEDRSQSSSTDIWLRPADGRLPTTRWYEKAHGGVCLALALATLCVGVMLLVEMDWRVCEPVYWRYLLVTLVAEIACSVCTGLAMLGLAVILGQASVVHSLSLFSLTNNFLLSITYALTFGCGCVVLSKLYAANLTLRPLPDRTNRSQTLEKIYCVYAAITTFTCFKYSLARLPAFFGVLKAITDRIRDKVNSVPVVAFYTRYNRGDDHYLRVVATEDYAAFAENFPPFHARTSSPLD